jgi:hypothetical protein
VIGLFLISALAVARPFIKTARARRRAGTARPATDAENRAPATDAEPPTPIPAGRAQGVQPVTTPQKDGQR